MRTFFTCIIIVYILQSCFAPYILLAQASRMSSKVLNPAGTRSYVTKNPSCFMVWFLLNWCLKWRERWNNIFSSRTIALEAQPPLWDGVNMERIELRMLCSHPLRTEEIQPCSSLPGFSKGLWEDRQRKGKRALSTFPSVPSLHLWTDLERNS